MIMKNNSTIDYLIKLGERYFKTDLMYLVKGSFWLTVGRVMASVVALFLSVLYANYLPKEIYGDYRYILSVLGALGIFALPGLATVIIRGVARGFHGTLILGMRMIFISSFGITLLSFIIAGWCMFIGRGDLALGFLSAALFVPFAEGLGNWRAYLEGRQEFKKKTNWNILSTLWYGIFMSFAVGIIYVYSLANFQSLIILLSFYFLGRALPNIWYTKKALREIDKGSPAEDGAIRYGLHLSLLEIPSTLANYLDAILLHAFIGPAGLAVYSFAIAPPEQLKGFMGTTAIAAFPKLAARAETEKIRIGLRNTLPGKIIRSTYITAAVSLMYIVAAPYLFSFFFPKYTDAVIYSQVFVLSLACFPFGLFGAALKAEGNLKSIYFYQLGSPVIQIVLFALLIPLYGLWGAISARVIGRSITYLLGFGFYKYYAIS